MRFLITNFLENFAQARTTPSRGESSSGGSASSVDTQSRNFQIGKKVVDFIHLLYFCFQGRIIFALRINFILSKMNNTSKKEKSSSNC